MSNEEEEIRPGFVPKPAFGVDHRSPEEREDWNLIHEWESLPRYAVRFRERGDRFDRVRIERPMPESWRDSEEGQLKIMRLTHILDRDPFTHFPPREGEKIVREPGSVFTLPIKPSAPEES